MLDMPSMRTGSGTGPIFVNQATITDVKAEKGKFSEVSLVVKAVMDNEQKWERTFFFNGGWERDQAGNIIGWGAMTREILPFFKAVNVPEDILKKLDETGVSGAIADCLQKEFSYISYLNEDGKSRTSKIVGPVGDDDSLIEKFKEQHNYWTKRAKKKMWWPKDFKGFTESDKANFEMNSTHTPAQTESNAVPF
tara:strand:+ start:133 stop:714 length:582 start_codon:yes stop_codon:yes gene_type:complete